MKRIKIVLILFLAVSLISTFQASAQQTLKIGDYIHFGVYYYVPILWRVVEIDEKGNPMLISDRIIALKPYDAKGAMKQNAAWPAAVIRDREHYGSNYWPDSNIRQWLNSFGQKLEWVKSPPSKENTFMNDNPYDQEKGFLANGNFNEYERSLILLVNHKVILATVDKGIKEGGEEIHISNDKIDQVMQNYDNSYYQMVTDGVFLPDVKEIHDIYLNESILGKDYFMAKPTQSAIDRSTYRNSALLVDQYWSYWLRTPFAGDGEPIRFVKADGKIDYDAGYGFDGSIGIRPALWLNNSSLQLSGTGSQSDPYSVYGNQQTTENNNKTLLISSGAILLVFLMVFTQKGSRNKKRWKKAH